MTDDPIHSPAYKVPLTEEQAARLGEFTAIWGQIDFFMGQCIAFMLKVDPGPAHTLMENLTSGPRWGLFQRLAKEKITDPKVLEIVKKFNKHQGPILEARNHMMHGLWGLYSDSQTEPKPAAAAFYPRHPNNPVEASQLPDLIKKASAQTHRIVQIAHFLMGFEWKFDPANPPKFYFGKKPPI